MSDPSESLLEHCMGLIREKLPVVDRTLSDYGHLTIDEYLDVITKTPSASYQPSDDLADVVFDYVAPLLGEETANLAREELRQSPVVLTANHHGVDYFAQSVQGTMIFSQRKLPSGERARTVPVLACSTVSMNNLTFPRGILAYDSTSESSFFPVKVPLFSNKYSARAVNSVPALGMDDLNRAIKSLRQARKRGAISTDGFSGVEHIVSNYYCSEMALKFDKYSDQAVVVNSHLWSGYLPGDDTTKLLYMDMESVCSRLVLLDLQNSSSLLYKVLFDEALRRQVSIHLSDISGCWTLDELERRWLLRSMPDSLKSLSCGTFLFWGVDSAGRRIPLNYQLDGDEPTLRGTSDAGAVFSVKLTSAELAERIKDKSLCPSVFSCFLTMSLARGVTCLGGYYQSDYLEKMKQGVIRALEEAGTYDDIVQGVSLSETTGYLSGMQAVMTKGTDGLFSIAGPVEMVKSGGLDAEDLRSIRQLDVRSAHYASILETSIDALGRKFLSNEHARTIVEETVERFSQRLVVI